MPKKIRVILTLNSAAQAARDELVEAIKSKGFEVDSVLESLGIITGKISESKLKSIAKMRGITVEREEIIEIAPPNAEVQ
jgi:hypothetical protein